MKELIILLFTLIAINNANAQWVPQNSGTTNNLNSVYFTDVNTGFAVGGIYEYAADGIILKTTNGGIDWVVLMSVDTLLFHSVFFTDANTGYVTGQRVIYPDYPAIILKTTNGGTTWNMVFIYTSVPGAENNISQIFFPDTNTGYALGHTSTSSGDYSSFIVKTLNGGATWTVDGSVSEYELHSIFFTSVDTGFAVGQGADLDWIILKTTNGGMDWTASNSGLYWNSAYLFSVDFPDENTGYAVGAYGELDSALILKTTNGGIDWIEQSSGISQFLTYYAFLSVVNFINADTGTVIGHHQIFKTTNGGTDWVEQPSGTDNYLNSSFFINVDTGYVVGDSGIILKTINGGGEPVGINPGSKISDGLTISPNPSTDYVTISFPTIYGNTQLSVFKISGEDLIEKQITNKETNLNISALLPGVYFVRLQNEKTILTKKFIKQ